MPDVFVFGSNLAGRHGAGAAKYAREHHKAIYGIAIGLQGESYAIPTKDKYLKSLPLYLIQDYIDEFLNFAYIHDKLTFNVTAIGCGLAGYTPEQIAPMFKNAPKNVNLPQEFKDVLQRY
jgi:hypothetical protein